MYKCTHIREHTCTHLCTMTEMDCELQRDAAVTLNISWTSFHFQFSFFFILACSALFFPKKGFIFVSLLPEKSWGKGVQTGKWKERGKKRSQRKKKKLWRIWRKGDWWETSSKGEAVAAAVSEQRWTSLFTLSYLPSCFVHIHMCRLCKVYSWKKRHCTPEETKTKTRLVVMIGKGENGFVI